MERSLRHYFNCLILQTGGQGWQASNDMPTVPRFVGDETGIQVSRPQCSFRSGSLGHTPAGATPMQNTGGWRLWEVGRAVPFPYSPKYKQQTYVLLCYVKNIYIKVIMRLQGNIIISCGDLEAMIETCMSRYFDGLNLSQSARDDSVRSCFPEFLFPSYNVRPIGRN